ncbi:hypothetical protein FSP39_003521, partial [Pinctada imbricata]
HNTSKCEKSWTEVEDVLSRADDVEVKIKPLRENEKDLLQTKNTYLQFCVELHDFLQRTSTEESKAELKRQLAKCTGNKKIMLKVLNQVKVLKQEALETLSVGSAISNTSGSSSATRKRAKTEVERAKLKIIAKQAEVMKQKAQEKKETKSKASAERKEAELNATLHVLKQKEKHKYLKTLTLKMIPSAYRRNWMIKWSVISLKRMLPSKPNTMRNFIVPRRNAFVHNLLRKIVIRNCTNLIFIEIFKEKIFFLQQV